MSEITREQLVMSVIAGRGPASLRGVDLSKLDLSGAGWLAGADLRQADLSNADLGRANLSGAMLEKPICGRVILPEQTLKRQICRARG